MASAGIPVHEDRRLLAAFWFATLPAIPVVIGTVYLLSQPDTLNFIIHPLGLLCLAGTLLLAALPVRLAVAVYGLRESSPQAGKLSAALQCAVPSLGLALVLPTALEIGFTPGRVLLLSFCGSYFAAFVILLLHVIRDAAKSKSSS